MNKHRSNIRVAALLSLILSILGIYLDPGALQQSVFVNILEVGLMSSILFVLFSSAYLFINYLFSFTNSSEDIRN